MICLEVIIFCLIPNAAHKHWTTVSLAHVYQQWLVAFRVGTNQHPEQVSLWLKAYNPGRTYRPMLSCLLCMHWLNKVDKTHLQRTAKPYCWMYLSKTLLLVLVQLFSAFNEVQIGLIFINVVDFPYYLFCYIYIYINLFILFIYLFFNSPPPFVSCSICVKSGRKVDFSTASRCQKWFWHLLSIKIRLFSTYNLKVCTCSSSLLRVCASVCTRADVRAQAISLSATAQRWRWRKRTQLSEKVFQDEHGGNLTAVRDDNSQVEKRL